MIWAWQSTQIVTRINARTGRHLVFALRGAAIQSLQQVSCFRQIGIEFEHAEDIISCTTGLPSVTKEPSDIHPNAALARRTPECVLPEPDSFPKVSTVGLDYAQIRCRIDQRGLVGKTFLGAL